MKMGTMLAVGLVAMLSARVPPPLALDRAALYRELLAQEQAEGSNPDHLSFLDRGLASSPFAADAPHIATRLSLPLDRERDGTGGALPPAGAMPGSIGTAGLAGMDAAIKNACVVVAEPDPEGLRVRWHGRQPLTNSQFWSATKVLQCFNLVSLVNEAHPEVPIASLRIGPAAGRGAAMPLARLMREIVSYEQGIARSNAGAEALGRFVRREQREALVEELTGHDVSFRGAYGAGSLYERPRLSAEDGQVLALGPVAIGETGPNLVSAYDMTRVIALAAWHPHLTPAQRIPGAQWHSLGAVLDAMGHDSARYADVAFAKLGLLGQVQDVVIATKLGFGFSSASGLAQLTYAGALQFTDRRAGVPVTRRACFALRGEHTSAVALDARMAVEVTDLVRLLANGEL